MFQEFFNVNELEELTGIRAQTWRKWMSTGKVQRVKICGRTLVHVDELARLIRPARKRCQKTDAGIVANIMPKSSELSEARV